MVTQEEVRALSQAHQDWPEVPPSCPDKFRVKICEFRKGVLDGSISTNRSNAARKAKAEQLLKAEETAANMKRLKLRYANLFS
jgi:hypothetical protein